MSIWVDVSFDHAAAASAAAACRRAAAGLDVAADGAATAAAEVVADWEGLARDRFDPAATATTGSIADVALACLTLADRIEAAADAATAEQRRRLAARDAELEARRRADEQRRREALQHGQRVPR